MSKKEFIDLLRESLEGEVDRKVLEQNVDYYNEYISSHSDKGEEEVIREIGDPRLIAKTIIDAEKLSYMDDRNDYSNYNRENYNDHNGSDDNRRSPNKVYHLKWYHMVLVVFIIIFVFGFLIRVGWLFLKLFSVLFVPIILISLLWTLFRKR